MFFWSNFPDAHGKISAIYPCCFSLGEVWFDLVFWFFLSSLGFSDGELNLNFLPVLFFFWALLRSCITLTFMMFVWLHKASLARQMGMCCLVMCHSASWRSDFNSDRLLEQIMAVSECLFSNCSTGSSRSFRCNQAVLFKLWFPLSSCFLVWIMLCQDVTCLILQENQHFGEGGFVWQ